MPSSDGRRTIAERDREARIRGDLLKRHDIKAQAVRVAAIAEEWLGIFVRLDGFSYEVARSADPSAARAVADALALVLDCPVDTQEVER